MADVMGVAADALGAWMDDNSAASAWNLAETADGEVVAVQRVGPGEAVDPDICEIATFIGKSGDALTIGSRLFAVTEPTARRLGFRFIDARFSPGNDAARIYYQSRGFRWLHSTREQTTMRYEID